MAKDVAKPRSIKVTDAMWLAWQGLAKSKGISVASLIIGGVEAVPVLHRQIAELAEAGDAARGLLAAKDGEIAALQTDVANLKRELAKRPLAVERHHLNEVTRPSMTPIDPSDPTSEKVVAKVLPVAGVQFERQPTWWEKKQMQAPAKGKRKWKAPT